MPYESLSPEARVTMTIVAVEGDRHRELRIKLDYGCRGYCSTERIAG